MRDGGGIGALEPQLAHTSQEPEKGRPRRRCSNRESQRAEKRTKGAGRGGLPQAAIASASTSAASLSRRAEPASLGQKRVSVGVAIRDRSPKRLQSEARIRFGGMEGNSLANGFSNMVVQQNQPHGLSMDSITTPCDRGDDQHDVKGRGGDYFPSIHDELGQLCLTRIPRSKIFHMSLVCKKWKSYLLGPDLYKNRRLQGVKEDWVFILGLSIDKQWRAYQPTRNKWTTIPPCPSDYTFDSCDKESMVAGLNLMVLGQGGDGYVVWRFDTTRSKWSTTPRMHNDRCLFGSASFGEFAYFAGGTSRGVLLKSVERYNSETDSWELLPDMNTGRKSCSGFVMDGKFHVIGGQQNSSVILNSGEAYDSATRTWTLIEGMWPQAFVPSVETAPPLVAVSNNQLYGINIIENTLMCYDKERNKWDRIERIPHRAENTNGWGYGFKAVGHELFVIGGARGPNQFLPSIHAYNPMAVGDQRWRFVTDLQLPANGFISNCAIMSG